jgi:hypothetical protein
VSGLGDAPAGDQPGSDDVDGLLGVVRRLWPEPADVRLVRGARQPGSSARDWLVLPSVGRPWLLLPAWSPTAAGALLRDDHGQRSPQVVQALAVLQRQRMLARLPLTRVRVSATPDCDTVERELTRILGVPSELVVRLGRRRWNRSVVLRPLDPAGDTLAFVKSASGSAGVASLRRERENLRRIATLAPALVEWPEVVHHGAWRDLELLALSPLVGDETAKRRARAPTDAMRALALAAEDTPQPLADVGLSRRLVDGAYGLSESAQRGQLLTGLDVTLSRLGQVKVPVGCWHGDWVPWNMTSHGDRVLLWDWEHFDDGVPVGLDGIHYRAQQLRMFKGTDPRVEDRWVREATEWLLNTFQLAMPQIRAVVLSYLLEINLRYLRDREHDPRGTPPREGWGLPLIGRLTAEMD